MTNHLPSLQRRDSGQFSCEAANRSIQRSYSQQTVIFIPPSLQVVHHDGHSKSPWDSPPNYHDLYPNENKSSDMQMTDNYIWHRMDQVSQQHRNVSCFFCNINTFKKRIIFGKFHSYFCVTRTQPKCYHHLKNIFFFKICWIFNVLKFDYDIEIQCDVDVGEPQVLLMKGKFAKHN